MQLDSAARRAIEDGCVSARRYIEDQDNAYEADQRKAKGDRKGATRPTCQHMSWVSDVAGRFEDCPKYVSASSVEDIISVSATLVDLLEMPEFQTVRKFALDVVWTPCSMSVKDGVVRTPMPGKLTVVSKVERACWPHGDAPPMWRMVLSIPWFLLASPGDQDQALHELLCQCGMGEAYEPYKRKADAIFYGPNAGRFGIVTRRQALTIAHLVSHPATPRRLRQAHGALMPDGTQMLLWPSRAGGVLDIDMGVDDSADVDVERQPVVS